MTKLSLPRSAFSLVEMAIVLAVIGIIVSTMLPSMQMEGRFERVTKTLGRMDRIEAALEAYKAVNGVLPCPAAVNLQPTDSGFGVAATHNGASPGSCISGGAPDAVDEKTTSPAVSFGAVPVRTLGLAEEDAFDGYTRLFSYHVSLPSVFDGSAGVIQVQDAAGSVETTIAAYAIVSHGQNGHGAYLRGGKRYNQNSTNAAEQENCDCNSSAVELANPNDYETRGHILVRDTASGEGTARFDDLIRFGPIF